MTCEQSGIDRVCVSGRNGFNSFINGVYDRQYSTCRKMDNSTDKLKFIYVGRQSKYANCDIYDRSCLRSRDEKSKSQNSPWRIYSHYGYDNDGSLYSNDVYAFCPSPDFNQCNSSWYVYNGSHFELDVDVSVWTQNCFVNTTISNTEYVPNNTMYSEDYLYNLEWYCQPRPHQDGLLNWHNRNTQYIVYSFVPIYIVLSLILYAYFQCINELQSDRKKTLCSPFTQLKLLFKSFGLSLVIATAINDLYLSATYPDCMGRSYQYQASYNKYKFVYFAIFIPYFFVWFIDIFIGALFCGNNPEKKVNFCLLCCKGQLFLIIQVITNALSAIWFSVEFMGVDYLYGVEFDHGECVCVDQDALQNVNLYNWGIAVFVIFCCCCIPFAMSLVTDGDKSKMLACPLGIIFFILFLFIIQIFVFKLKNWLDVVTGFDSLNDMFEYEWAMDDIIFLFALCSGVVFVLIECCDRLCAKKKQDETKDYGRTSTIELGANE